MTATVIIAAVVGLVVGALIVYFIFLAGSKSKYKAVIKEAEAEAEVIKKNKLLEVKEKFLKLAVLALNSKSPLTASPITGLGIVSPFV